LPNSRPTPSAGGVSGQVRIGIERLVRDSPWRGFTRLAREWIQLIANWARGTGFPPSWEVFVPRFYGAPVAGEICRLLP